MPILVILLTLLLMSTACGHEDAAWIAQQKLKNRMGEACCGVSDCSPVDKHRFYTGPGGYVLPHQFQSSRDEHIPYSEAMPFSPDGRLWICRKSDGTRRCVFDLPPGM